MNNSNVWKAEHFPVVYEGSEAKAVIVDYASFAKIEMIMDNLINREAEPEDELVAAAVKHLLTAARTEKPTADWRQELDEL